jgi:glycosyltransferase involved in cell wall biosynthesis
MSYPDLAGPGVSGPEVVLDLSRLMSRVSRTTPTGIDRVELVYALMLLDLIPERVSFGGRYPYGVYGRLDRQAVRQFLAYTSDLWSHGSRVQEATLLGAAGRHLAALRPRPIPAARGRRVFLQVSPHQLDREARMVRILRREGARFVAMIHDLIPIEFPEFARPSGAEQHRQRMATVSRLADGVVANSEATRDVLARHLHTAGRSPRIAVAHLGTEAPDLVHRDASVPDQPYFVYVATIEPRKNHLLLLNVWKRLAERLGRSAPVLHLVGRRGWENEQVVDMLERCVPLQGRVVEHANMSDRQVSTLMAGARALLFPSFAEGFGMPVAEALMAGVPVIASDIPALRELGQGVPEYLDPIDGLAWLEAIESYANAPSERRAAQIARLSGWRASSWQEHLDTVLTFIDSL